MNSDEAMEAINETLEAYYRGTLTAYEAINQISRIKGEHDTRRQQ